MKQEPPRIPYPYNRRRHLSFILRVPGDWLRSSDPAITALIVKRLERAAAQQRVPGPRSLAIAWALAAERGQP